MAPSTVDCVGEDGHIHELRWIDGSWGDSDLSDLGGSTADVLRGFLILTDRNGVALDSEL